MNSWMIFWLFNNNLSPNNFICWKEFELNFFAKEILLLVHPWTWHVPSCHRAKLTCDNLISHICTNCAVTECSIMQPSKTHHVTNGGTIGSVAIVTRLHISCILCFSLMLTSHFVSCPLHLFTHPMFFTSMCLSVCWPWGLCFVCVAFRLYSSAIP